MKENKKIIAAILAFVMLLTSAVMLPGCGGKQADSAPTETGAVYEYYEPQVEYEAEYYDNGDEIEFNTEEYNHIDENGFISASLSPLSTFSADVDTASYTNVRRVVNAGNVPQPDMVRIEEMLNYFHYDYAEPENDEPFAVTMEMSTCPWNADTKLLLVGLQAKKIETEQLPDSNFVFLIDCSGSMNSYDKLPLVQQAFSLLTEQLGENDRVSIVTYASGDRVVLEGADGGDKAQIIETIRNLKAAGATAGAAGINTAYEIAERYFIKGGNNRVILATDGDLNVGVSSEGELTRLIESKRDKGIYLSVLGFGTGNLKDNKMEALADNGNGNFSYIDSVAEARRVLVGEMGGTLFTVAKDVKFQMDFNPAQIKAYRLIGYENRIMAAEDFNNDQKDAGEIGAGHRVTVLYEIVDKDSAYEFTAPESEYQQTADNGSDNLFTLNIRYKQPDADESQLLKYPTNGSVFTDTPSDNFTLAAAVAEVGMLLRKSEFSGTATYSGAGEMLKTIDGILDNEELLDFYSIIKNLSAMTGEPVNDSDF